MVELTDIVEGFTGIYNVIVSAKARIQIPTRWREALKKRNPDTAYFYLVLFQQDEAGLDYMGMYDKVGLEKYLRGEDTTPKVIIDLPIDEKEKRTNIGLAALNFLKVHEFNRKLLLVGYGDYVRIYDAERYLKREAPQRL